MIVGVTVDVCVIVGVTVTVDVIVGVTEGVTEGVIVGVGVCVPQIGVAVISDVGAGVLVFVGV